MRASTPRHKELTKQQTTPTCPICAGTRVIDTVRRARLPTMQNYVHRTRESALAARDGGLVLSACRACGFAWNRVFDPERLVYDDNYDNNVPSDVMRRYYGEIVAHLVDKHRLRDGLVVDIGCGDGSFLQSICAAVPGLRGLGIDPALEGDRREGDDGGIVLVKNVFSPDVIVERASLVVLRSVLQHIPQPVGFLQSIVDAVGRFGPSPVFIEVPNLEWILNRQAFWDFCYEHCNYFSAASLTQAVERAGPSCATTRTAFGGQYLWAEATIGRPTGRFGGLSNEKITQRLIAYAAGERSRVEAARAFLQRERTRGSAIVVWGMSTKGVLFANLTDPTGSAIRKCIDVNPNKQHSYVPLTGHLVEGPEALRDVGGPMSILVMNENYRSEIECVCADLEVDATFTNASLHLR
jgi:hypothetical protein